MNRTAWLQDRRMAKFCDVLSRWKAKELSAQEAGEILEHFPAALNQGDSQLPLPRRIWRN